MRSLGVRVRPSLFAALFFGRRLVLRDGGHMADVIRFTCSKCGQKYRAPAHIVGRTRTCAKCGAQFRIAGDGTTTNIGVKAIEAPSVSVVPAPTPVPAAPVMSSPLPAVPVAAIPSPAVVAAVEPAAMPVAAAPAPVVAAEERPAAVEMPPAVEPTIAVPTPIAPATVAAAPAVPPVSVAPIVAAATAAPQPLAEVPPMKMPVVEATPVRPVVAEPMPMGQPMMPMVQVVQQFVEIGPVSRPAMQPATPVAEPLAAPTVPELPAPEKKQCPFCGEDILKMAVKCKHCGEFLDGSGPKPVEPPVEIQAKNNRALADAWARAELAAADTRVRADRAGADARAKADEVAAVARRNEERRAAIHRQIEMQAESDYRQVLLRAADSLAAAEKSAVSMCRFYSDVYHAVERMGLDAAAAISQADSLTDREDPGKNTLSVVSQVMDLVDNPPVRFYRAHEKILEAFKAYSDMEGIWRSPSASVATREALLADLHNRFTTSMADMRALIRTSEYPGA